MANLIYKRNVIHTLLNLTQLVKKDYDNSMNLFPKINNSNQIVKCSIRTSEC